MEIQERSNPTTSELQQEMKRIASLIHEPFVIKAVSIGTASTAVAHGLGFAPTSSTLAPFSPVAWGRAAAADAKNVYFSAASPVIADVVIFP